MHGAADGGTHLFVHRRRGVPLPFWPHDQSLVALPSELGPEHVLASTAIPFAFSPVKIGGYWYSDGGLRQNVPLSPALRLGADALLAVSLGRVRPADEPAPHVFPGMSALLGKLLNGIFLDRMHWDLDRMGRINDVLDSGTAAYGEAFTETLQRELRARGRQPYRKVPFVSISPSADIGAVAADICRSGRLASDLGPVMRRLIVPAHDRSADLASYLLFDGAFAAELIALGRAAAARRADALGELL
ncbi:MAG: patatin-like phospholipase family protein [Deltaproteobacteria bacterium]|nr:patatin-like phospholipase family protein [Deltaproteobacteria bacterium]